MTTIFLQVRVVSLGWVELSEDMLTSENSSKAVNRYLITWPIDTATQGFQRSWSVL